MTVEQFIKDLPKKGQFAALTLNSVVKMNKRNNPFHGRVTYAAKYSILVNVVYSNMVNNQLDRENKAPTFTSNSLWKGKGEYYYRSPIGPLARHIEKGTKYLSYSPLKLLSFQYFVDGKPATQSQREAIKAFLPKKKISSRQGTEKIIPWRLVKLENIISLTADKKTWAL